MRCYIYCTKAKPYLYRIDDDNEFELRKKITYSDAIYDFVKDYHEQNGKVVALFELKEVEKFNANNISKEILEKSCLTKDAISNYLGDKEGYGWVIENLEIFDKPMNLSDFETQGICNMYDEIKQRIMGDYIKKCYFKLCKYNYMGETCDNYSHPIIKAPQSWQYVYDKKIESSILISIKSEWLFKILNKEKTIEVRKKAPEEVLE